MRNSGEYCRGGETAKTHLQFGGGDKLGRKGKWQSRLTGVLYVAVEMCNSTKIGVGGCALSVTHLEAQHWPAMATLCAFLLSY